MFSEYRQLTVLCKYVQAKQLELKNLAPSDCDKHGVIGKGLVNRLQCCSSCFLHQSSS